MSCSASDPRRSKTLRSLRLGLPTIDVDVVVQEDLGSDAHVFFRVDATRVATDVSEGEAESAADLVTDRGALLNARVDPRTSARVGAPLRLAVDPGRFHFFDPGSGASLLGRDIAPSEPTVVTVAQ